MNEKRFTCETKTQGSVSIDLMKDNGQIIEKFEAINLLNELHDELMDLRAENTQFKLVVSKIIRDMQKLVDEDQIVYINQSYVDWIKDNVDTELNAELK